MWCAISLSAFYGPLFQWMISINTNASTTFNFITKPWSISWSESGCHMEGSMHMLGSVGPVCPSCFSIKPGLMCYSAKVNSHLASYGARKTLKKLCLIVISLLWLFMFQWLFISWILNSQRTYMTAQSSQIADLHFFCLFFCHVKIYNQCCIL